MLQGFRVIINSFVGKVFFAVLVATFGLLGVGYGFRDLVLGATGSNDAASIGDTKISLDALQRQFRLQLSNYQRQLGPTFTPTPQIKQEIARSTLDQQVSDALYAEAARRNGLRIDNALVRKAVEMQPAFQNDRKTFDPMRFQLYLENQNQTEAAFVAQIRENIARELLTFPIAGNPVAPKSLVEDMFRYRTEQRVAQTVTIPDSSASGIAAPTDADLQTYYQKHAVGFTKPEYRTFTVLNLTPALFMGEVNPTDEDLHAAYDSHKSEYIVPEKRKIEQVVVDDKAVAETIAKAAQAGKSLKDAAAAATSGKSQPVALDFLTRDDLPTELVEPVFTAQPKTVVGPVQSPLGWHVIEVTEIKTGSEVKFDDVKGKLTEDLKKDGAADRLSEQVDKLGDKLLGGAPMDEVAASVNAATVKVGPVDAKGNLAAPPADGKSPPVDSAWIAAASHLQQGETSTIQDGKDGNYFVVRLDSVTAPELRPLAEVRDQVVAGWTAEQRAAAIAKRAADLTAKARAGTAMSQIATEAGGKLETTAALTRDPLAAGAGQPSALIDALFKLDKVGDVGSVAVPEGQVILKLTEIKGTDPLGPNVDLTPLTREIEAAIKADTLAQYNVALRDDFKVKINPQAVETVVGQ
jgi:peptidyl-prolyl cis-trans isomerase D